MKKKLLLSLFILLGFTCLTGCDSNSETVEDLLTALQKEEIVDKDLKLVDKVINTNAGIVPSKDTYYIYESEESNLIAINYDTDIYSKNDFDYSISIYYDISTNDKVEYVDDVSSSEEWFSYQDGTKSEENKYNLNNEKVYLVYEKNGLFSNKYTFELQN